MKIAISTIPVCGNYGAVLQSFALMHYLERLGHDAKLIYYANRHMEKGLDAIRFERSLYGIYMTLHDVIRYFPRKRKRKAYFQFFNDYFQLTDRLAAQQIPKWLSDKGFDLYLCGSDQIWNPEVTNGKLDPVYFCFMAPDGAVIASYASSFGGYAYPNKEERKQAGAYLNRLRKISVREKSGLKTLEEQFRLKGVAVADPVLLLDKREWNEIFQLDRPPRNPYALVYAVKNQRLLVKLAQKTARKHGLEVKVIGETLCPLSAAYAEDAGPVEFMKLIYNSGMVFTNSFHGTAFALTFNRPFVALDNGISSRSVRITDLLEEVGLRERYVRYEDADSLDKPDDDYIAVNVRLDSYRECSKRYLAEVLQVADRERIPVEQ